VIDPKKILVIRFSSIGDIVLSSPLLRVLRIRFPLAIIDFIVRKEYADLVRYDRNLNLIYEFDAKEGLDGLRRLKTQLKMEHYDLVVDIHNSFRSKYLRTFLGVKNIVTINKRIFARTLLVNFKKNCYQDITSVVDRYIEAVGKYGVINDGAGLALLMPDKIYSAVSAKIKLLGLDHCDKVIGFCPSAKHTTKCWPQENFAELGIRLIKNGDSKILLFGGPSDRQKCKSIADAINVASGEIRAFSVSDELSLLETAAAMKLCDIVVTNDSGLMHIASAMGKNIIAIFGSTVQEFGFFPVNKDSIVIERKGLYCRPCSHIGLDSCPEKHFRCMNDIQVSEVVDSIQAFKKKISIQI
jgi:heptosyltransferase-2